MPHCLTLFLGDFDNLINMKLKKTILIMAMFALQGCPSVYYSEVGYEVYNNFNRNIKVSMYGFLDYYSVRKDTILYLAPTTKGTIFIDPWRGTVRDYWTESNGKLTVRYDSLVVTTDNLRSSKKFDKKTDWQYIKDGEYKARYVLTIDASTF
jgi:hypothetical protein